MSLRIHGNRLLKTLPGEATRPTPSKVRQALFNIWQGDILGCRWLDLCTGSGAMGAEALCRGAAIAVGIDLSREACELIQENWQQVATAEQRFEIIQGDVVRSLRETRKGTFSDLADSFDRIYFDPPYTSDLYEPVLEAIGQYQLLAPGGELAAEHSPRHKLPAVVGSLRMKQQRLYGKTAISFYA
jgi:16S rRNA (guanine966-N2)-methyltransferase